MFFRFEVFKTVHPQKGVSYFRIRAHFSQWRHVICHRKCYTFNIKIRESQNAFYLADKSHTRNFLHSERESELDGMWYISSGDEGKRKN